MDIELLRHELYLRLNKVYPNGHPEFLSVTLDELELHNNKNHDYASGGNPTGNFDRAAAIFALYPGLRLSDPIVYCLSLMMKQLDAVLWGLSNNIQHKVENLDSRFADISVYTKIARCMWRDRDKKC